MRIKDYKNIATKHCDTEVEQLAKKTLDILISCRITELKQMLSNNDGTSNKTELQRKIDLLKQPYNQKFYQQLMEETKKDMMQGMMSKIEKASINRINAEYFGFEGRL